MINKNLIIQLSTILYLISIAQILIIYISGMLIWATRARLDPVRLMSSPFKPNTRLNLFNVKPNYVNSTRLARLGPLIFFL